MHGKDIMIYYALIRDNAIEKIRGLAVYDALLVSKMKAHDYRIIEEQAIPIYDDITQILTFKYIIWVDKVLKTLIVNERVFGEAQALKQNDVETQALGRIKGFFGNASQNTKIANVLTVKDTAILAVKASKTNAELRLIKPVFPEAIQIEP